MYILTKNKTQIFKITFALILLFVLIAYVDVSESIKIFKRLNYVSITLIFLLTFLLISISVFKWKMFLKSLNLYHSFWKLFQIYTIGYFFNNFLPSNVGGDAVRLSMTAKGNNAYSDSFVAVFMERLTGIAVTLLMAIFGLPIMLLKYNFMESIPLVIIPSSVILIFILSTLLLTQYIFEYWECKIPLIKYILNSIRKIFKKVNQFANEKELLFKALLFSIIFNLVAVLNVYIVGVALELHIPFIDMLLLVPLILVISAIPLSINSIGLAESAYVICLSQAGVNASEALSIALLMRAKTLIVSLMGGFFYFQVLNIKK